MRTRATSDRCVAPGDSLTGQRSAFHQEAFECEIVSQIRKWRYAIEQLKSATFRQNIGKSMLFFSEIGLIVLKSLFILV